MWTRVCLKEHCFLDGFKVSPARPYGNINIKKKKCEKASDRLRQRAKKKKKNRVGRFPTSEQNWKIILSDKV
jgi:hypothetical protein